MATFRWRNSQDKKRKAPKQGVIYQKQGWAPFWAKFWAHLAIVWQNHPVTLCRPQSSFLPFIFDGGLVSGSCWQRSVKQWHRCRKKHWPSFFGRWGANRFFVNLVEQMDFFTSAAKMKDVFPKKLPNSKILGKVLMEVVRRSCGIVKPRPITRNFLQGYQSSADLQQLLCVSAVK